ncbi:hypothetical protein SAMN04487936_106233 [Halobacillus dabanensis]|uniref:Tubby C 2 n=1 Tax=Halobacillus dabanensis TaxID=240302 RepID=A0A1I3W7N5_HALDA|nr:hypothetical protein [Halobacillus dabanensis]SFK03430.1 hypothetical protein SAMN04487936_106233 [Halobacillus dabanensis]
MQLTSNYYKLQRESIHPYQSRQFGIINKEDERVATFEEEPSTSSDLGNQFLNLINLHPICSFKMKLLTPNQEVLARLIKKKGWYNSILVQTKDENITLHFKGSISQNIFATDENGTTLFHCTGKNMASDFSIESEQGKFATIHKRSIAAPTTKEAWLSEDLYHIRANEWTKTEVLAILSTTVMIDLYYHRR